MINQTNCLGDAASAVLGGVENTINEVIDMTDPVLEKMFSLGDSGDVITPEGCITQPCVN